jgi:hypothetical protein
MLIHGQQGETIEILLNECLPPGTPRAGDIELLISVQSGTFAAKSAAWVALEDYRSFLSQLRQLEVRREGSASIESMSPNEFVLTIGVVNRKGGWAVTGRLQTYVFGDEGRSHVHAVEFGFDGDADRLLMLVNDFSALFAPAT